jgi:hypothetical protein
MNKYFWTNREIEIIKNTDLTLSEMMELLPNRSYSGIRGQIKKQGLSLSKESISKAHTLAQLGIKELDIDKILLNIVFIDIVNGNLLGDAWISKFHTFGLASINRDFVEHINFELNNIFKTNSKIGIKKKSNSIIYGKKFSRKKQYSTYKSCKPIFKLFYNKWYNNKKIIPDDLELTPRGCYYWYVGDGCLNCNPKKSVISISLATNGFSKTDVEKLICKLNCKIEGLNASIQERKNHKSEKSFIIYIGSSSVLRFLDYVGEPFLKSFSYKWDIQGYSEIKTICKCCNREFIHYGFNKEYRVKCSECRKK